MNNNRLLIWYASINILPIKKYKIFKEYKEIEKIYKAKQNELLKIEGVDLIDISEIEKSKNLELIKKYEEYINKNQIKVISINDKYYPISLKDIYDPPIILFAKGNLELLKSDKISIVGSRDADNYGLKHSYEIAYNLSYEGITVVSGMAKGIDAMAHLR